MARLFLTAEDVARAKDKVIRVDPQTLVTPQAQEVARAAGIQILTTAGMGYSEPAADRGPDAERAMRSLPNLPEPEAGAPTGVVVSAVGKNRPGVLAEITAALGQAGADVHGVSQSVADGYFQLILTVSLANATTGIAPLKDKLQCLGGPDDYVVRVMHERVFRFMHRV